MNPSDNFGKRPFIEFIMAEYGLSRIESNRLYDSIAAEMKRSLLAGGTVKLFGLGALKLAPRRTSGTTHIRFRPAPSIDISGIVVAPSKDGDKSADEE